MLLEETKIGILGVQGAFIAHFKALQNIEGILPVIVKYPSQLDECSGLILPGGESTTQNIVGAHFNWHRAIREFAHTNPVLGTCAGLILMQQLGLFDIDIKRNGFGPQTESFTAQVILRVGEKKISQTAHFIRAPRISKVHGCNVLATLNCGEPVCIQDKTNMMIGCTFHPELCPPSPLHSYFATLCSRRVSAPCPLPL